MKALFFDLDGTLTDINHREIEAIYDTVQYFGQKVSRTRIKQLLAQTPSYIDVYKKLGFELTDASIGYWTSAFIKRYPLSVVRNGVESTLKALSEEYMLVCVTSRETQAEVVEELEYLHLKRWFSHIVTRDVAAKHLGQTSIPFFPFYEQRRKLYECALSLAKCSPNDTVVIGDMGRELKPAKELGITTIGLVTSKVRENELRETSDFLITSITQFKSVLADLNKPATRSH